MNEAPTFKAEPFDLISAVNSRTLTGEFRGHDAWVSLLPNLDSLPPTSAFILDMSRVNMLDYNFSISAFGPLFDKAKFQSSFRQIVFVLAAPARNAFFEGILKANCHPIASYSESQQMFVRAGLHCKVTAIRSGQIDFVGDLSADEATVLASVNQLKQGPIERVVEHSGLRWEAVHDNLRALSDKGFVMEYQGHDYSLYLSYYIFLERLES